MVILTIMVISVLTSCAAISITVIVPGLNPQREVCHKAVHCYGLLASATTACEVSFGNESLGTGTFLFVLFPLTSSYPFRQGLLVLL